MLRCLFLHGLSFGLKGYLGLRALATSLSSWPRFIGEVLDDQFGYACIQKWSKLRSCVDVRRRGRLSRELADVLLLSDNCLVRCIIVAMSFVGVISRVVICRLPSCSVSLQAFEILLKDLEEGFAKFEEDLINYTESETWVRGVCALGQWPRTPTLWVPGRCMRGNDIKELPGVSMFSCRIAASQIPRDASSQDEYEWNA